MVEYSRDASSEANQRYDTSSTRGAEDDKTATPTLGDQRPGNGRNGKPASGGLIRASHGETISQGRRSLFRR